MSIAVIDVREWQTMVDLETGTKVQKSSGLIDIAKRVISNRCYPGDIDTGGIDWVVDTALDLNLTYEPELFFLSFAQPYFFSVFRNASPSEWEKVVKSVFANIERFLDSTGFEPIIIGLGDMAEVKGYIDMNNLEGLSLSTNWSYRYGGMFDAISKDIEVIKASTGVKALISKEEFKKAYNPSNDYLEHLPNYLITAKEGYTFKSFQCTSRRLFRIPAENEYIPVHTQLGSVKELSDIRKLVDSNLGNRKIAVIVIEGIGFRDFKYQSSRCLNAVDWFTYDQGENHYLAISTGEHYYKHENPPVYKYYEENSGSKKYPFSGNHKQLPQNTMGRKPGIKSAAVGSRGMMTHVASGADISIECYSRNLYNMGTMAIINDDEASI